MMPSVTEVFLAVSKEHNLYSQTDSRCDAEGYKETWKLIRILKEGEKFTPLPPDFVEKVRQLAIRYELALIRKLKRKANINVTVSPTGMTITEIKAAQREIYFREFDGE